VEPDESRAGCGAEEPAIRGGQQEGKKSIMNSLEKIVSIGPEFRGGRSENRRHSSGEEGGCAKRGVIGRLSSLLTHTRTIGGDVYG